MAATDKQFAGSIPETYDRFLVPLIFESYARDLAERLARVEPREVLETAAGTGVRKRDCSSTAFDDVAPCDQVVSIHRRSLQRKRGGTHFGTTRDGPSARRLEEAKRHP